MNVFNQSRVKKTFIYLHGFGILIFIFVILSFLLPIIASFLSLFNYKQNTEAFLSIQRLWYVTVFTLSQALLSATLAVIIGLGAGFLVARRQFFGRRFLMSLAGLPLAIPPIIIALAFIVFFGHRGFINSQLIKMFYLKEPPLQFLYSFVGLILAHGFYNFPIPMRTISQTWQNLNEDEEHAAILLGASKIRIFYTIVLPALLPAIATSFLIVFLYSFFSFVIVLLFGGIGTTVLEIELYQVIRMSLHSSIAAKIILIELFFSSIAVFLYLHIQKENQKKVSILKLPRQRICIKGYIEKTFFIFLIGLIAFFLLGPLLSIVVRSFMSSGYASIKSFTFESWINVFTRPSFWQAVWTTISVGLMTASLAVITALFFAYVYVFKKNSFSFFAFFPLMISPLALGFGWTILVHRSNIFVLAFAQAALAWPFAWTQIQTGISAIPHNIIFASKILAAPREAFFMTILPLCKKRITMAFAFVFAISAGDASLPLVLAIPGFQNIALLIFRLAGSYRFAESTVVAAFLAFLTATVFFLQDEI